MARDKIPAEVIEQYATEFAELADELRKCAGDMKNAGLPHAWLHVKTIRGQHIPKLFHWIESVKKDVNEEIRAYRAGVQSTAVSNREKAAKQAKVKKKKGT